MGPGFYLLSEIDASAYELPRGKLSGPAYEDSPQVYALSGGQGRFLVLE